LRKQNNNSMSTKDERPGLLSKVALFVRNPTRDWSELDQPSQQEDTGYDKQALQAMIERKRQNDFIRRREFDQLRKLRNRNPASAVGTARTSNFQNSLTTDQDGRAVTLKKIDEIEAQMSRQWWKNKTDAADFRNAADGSATVPASGIAVLPSDAQRARAFDATQPIGVTQPPKAGTPSDFLPTQMSDMARLMATTARDGLRKETDFSVSRLFVHAADEIATDPELEEAAIRFANGDVSGAEKSLLDALRGKDLAPVGAQSWASALLDLYRATNRRTDFNSAAEEFYIHLDGAHPVWINLVPGSTDHAPLPPAAPFVWPCPEVLNAAHMQHLQGLMASNEMPWHMDWSAVRELAPTSMTLLDGLFDSLCNEPVEICCIGLPMLQQALQARAPRGDRTVDQIWWKIRLNVLRVMGLQDEFELLALDYCLTYEIAPFEWKEAQCRLTQSEPASMQDAGPSTSPMSFGDEEGLCALRGEILGDATEALQGLLDFQSPGQLLLIGCSQLLRVDFAAAGSILNWVAARQLEGRLIQFHNVHRLVAAFFNVIGINEHAKVVPRPL